jgi:hypothetical protein
MIRIILLVAGVVAVVLAGFGWLATRSPVSATSTVNPRVTIQCAAATGVSPETCRAWGDESLADDRATRTFDRKDLRRVAFDRSMFGFGGDCTVAWFIERDTDEPVWFSSVPCR